MTHKQLEAVLSRRVVRSTPAGLRRASAYIPARFPARCAAPMCGKPIKVGDPIGRITTVTSLGVQSWGHEGCVRRMTLPKPPPPAPKPRQERPRPTKTLAVTVDAFGNVLDARPDTTYAGVASG